MLKRMLLCMSLLGATISGASANAPGTEIRTHYVVTGRDRAPVYRATTISTDSETSGNETYLFESTAGQRIRIDVRRNYKSRLVTAEYKVNEGHPVKVTLQLPGNASTRSETLKRYKERPETRGEDIPISVDSRGQILKTGEKEWRSGKVDVREKAKSVAGSQFVAAMKPFRSILGFPAFGGACSTFEFVSDGQKCVMSTELMIAIIRPDCEFDAKLGMPCDSAQKQRAKQQPQNGKVGSY